MKRLVKFNYFGEGLGIGLLTGIVVGLFIENLAANIVLFTFLGGAIGALIRRKRR